MDPAEIVERLPETTRAARPHGFACDTCRRRRVKCDGNQPCDRCIKSDVLCTYGSATNRTSAVAYARYLERQVAELQALLLERSQDESSTQSSQMPTSPEDNQQQSMDMLIGPGDDYVYRVPQTSSNTFYGRFGGLNLLRAVGDMAPGNPVTARTFPRGRDLVHALEYSSFSLTPNTPDRFYALLPPPHQAQNLIRIGMRTGLICHDCMDRTELPRGLDRLYEIDPEDYQPDDHKFLTLVYALLALGRRAESLDEPDEVQTEPNKIRVKGLSYFLASYKMLDVTNCHDLDSIRTIICQARYLFSVSMLSKAYSVLCIGIAAALRMGLHVSGPALRKAFTGEEMFQRRRVFAVLNLMDTYMSSMIGIPKILRDADKEQLLGLRDEDLHDEGRSFILQNPRTPAAETLLGQKINFVMAKILETRYPVRKQDAQLSDAPFEENADFVATHEVEIEKWFNDLSSIAQEPSDERALEAQLMLRLWHSAIQIMLYRPFLHHLARDRQDPNFNIRGYEYGSACVRAAMSTVWVVEAFQINGFLQEAYWLIIYTLGFTANILIFFVTSCPQRATVEEVAAAARKAKDMLGWLAKYNLSARRCFVLVSQLIDSISGLPDVGMESDS